MELQAISVKNLRENFPKVREGLKNGFPYLLIYRSEPIAEIRPLRKRKKNNVFKILANPPKTLQFKSKISSVELIRRERD